VREEPAVYDATAADLLHLVRAAPPSARAVLLVGHEPGPSRLVASLASGGDVDALTALRRKYPMDALASLAVEGEWSALDAGSARLVAFVRPRDLER
jgi:phosphohistidine phosphatase